MRLEAWHSAFLIFPSLVLLHLWISPFTKVEESFNIQAVHDILTNGIPSPFEKYPHFKFIQQYDHMTFPGAVPRTFIGALILAGFANPVLWYARLSLPTQQLLVRAVLGLLNAGALLSYTYTIRRTYGRSTAGWFTFLLGSQFHVFYYGSRTLPNMFAFAISTFALSLLLPVPGMSTHVAARRTRVAFYLLTIATIIFRAELALLLFSHIVHRMLIIPPSALFQQIRRIIIPALIAGTVAGLTLTITIDTYFWRPAPVPHFLKQPLWPELVAFLSNVFPKDGIGANAWGTSPWHWYFTSAIPRLFLNPLLIPLQFYNLFTPRRNDSLHHLYPPLLYTGLYSILSHKETRFLFPIIPSLTLLPALALSQLSISSLRSPLAHYAKNAIIATTLLTALIAHTILLPLSSLSYPGGSALLSLHTLSTTYPPQRRIDVHLTNLALQTGVTRFLQNPMPKSPLVILPGSHDGRYPAIKTGGTLWQYDKSDNGTTTTAGGGGGVYGDLGFWDKFDYVVVEDPEHALPVGGWDVVDKIAGLGRLRMLGPDVGRGLLVFGDKERQREKDGLQKVVEAMYGQRLGRAVGWMYGVVHDVLREGYGVPGGRGLTGGRWVHWGMDWRLYVLKRGEK